MTIFGGLLAGEDYVRKGLPIIPATPSALVVDSVTTSTVTLEWTDESDNETGFRVEYKLASDSEWTFSQNVAADVETATITGLTDGTTYDFRIRAFSSSAYSEWVEVEDTTAYDFANGVYTDGVNDQWAKTGLTAPSVNLSDFTISCWMRFPTGAPVGGSGQRWIRLSTTGETRNIIVNSTNPLSTRFQQSVLITGFSGGTVSGARFINTSSNFHHVAIVVDSTNLLVKIYIDGELAVNTLGDTSFPLNVACSFAPNEIVGVNFEWGAKVGYYDNLAVIRKVLTADEVAQIWNGGNGSRFVENLPTSEKFVFYKFNGVTAATTAAVDEINEGGVNRDLTLANGANYQPFNP